MQYVIVYLPVPGVPAVLRDSTGLSGFKGKIKAHNRAYNNIA